VSRSGSWNCAVAIDATSLSADGRTLAVGALEEDSAASGIGGNQNDGNATGAGAVYLY
jgi:trimeric autotransporter adhesin